MNIENDFEVPVPEGIELAGYQIEGVKFCLPRKVSLIADQPGVGKAQPIDSKVLTPSGWECIGNLKIGDKIFGSSGNTVKITGVFPQGIKDVYKIILNDGLCTESCLEHLWKVSNKNWKQVGKMPPYFKVRSTEQIRSLLRSDKSVNIHVPIVEPIKFEEILELPVPPYTLGALLGDGYLPKSNKDSITITSMDSDVIDRIREECDNKFNLKLVASHERIEYRIVKKELNSYKKNLLIDAIKKLELNGTNSDNKFIPKMYLTAPVDDRINILRGLMDTDGSVNKDGSTRFSSNSAILISDIIELVLSLGGSVYPVRTELSKSGKNHYSVCFKMRSDINPFYLGRKAKRWKPLTKYKVARIIKSIEYSRKTECVCISVDSEDSLYVTDNYILTHNTPQAVGVVNCYLPKRVLIVCPASLKTNWNREWNRFTVHDLDVGITNPKTGWPNTPIVITNYEQLAKYDKEIKSVTWDVVILDEAHAIKNPEAQRTRHIIGCKAKRKYKGKKAQPKLDPLKFKKMILLTGTPMLNRPVDLWTFCLLGDPNGLGRSYEEFIYTYCKAWMSPWGLDVSGSSNPEELNRRLKETFMIRRLKKDVLKDLPDKRRRAIELPTDGLGVTNLLKKEQDLYKKLNHKIDFSEDVEKLKEKADPTTLEELNEYSSTRQEVALKKLPMVFEFVDSLLEQGEKVIIFAYHKSVLKEIHDRYGKHGVQITGSTPVPDRQDQVDKFQNDPNITVFSGQFTAAGTGHTLTASSTVVMAEMDYTPAILEQAEDRAHRRGQKNAVMVWYLCLEGSLDADMTRQFIEKSEIIDKTLND